MNSSKLCEIMKDREAWSATVHGIAKSWTQLSSWTTTTCKLMIIWEIRFAQPQNQASLLNNKTMQQKHEMWPQTIKQWWHETHILPSELSKLTILQFSSVPQSCPTLCDPMDYSTPGLPVHHQLPEFTQTHVHWVSAAIQPSHPLSSPSPAFNLSQYQGLL